MAWQTSLKLALIIGEKEEHALISPEQGRYGLKDLRNRKYARLTCTLSQGGVLMGSINGEILILNIILLVSSSLQWSSLLNGTLTLV